MSQGSLMSMLHELYDDQEGGDGAGGGSVDGQVGGVDGQVGGVWMSRYNTSISALSLAWKRRSVNLQTWWRNSISAKSCSALTSQHLSLSP